MVTWHLTMKQFPAKCHERERATLRKPWRQTGNSSPLPAKCWPLLHVIAGISARFTNFAFVLLSNKSLNDWSLGEKRILFPSNLDVSLDFVTGNIEIRGKQNSLFFSGPVIKCLLLYSWRFSRYSAPIHWLVHGHMTSNNETVPAKCHERATLRKLWRQTGNRPLLTAKCRPLLHVIAGISAQFSNFAFILFCYLTNHLMTGPLGKSEFCFPRISMIRGKQNSLFPSGPVIKCLLSMVICFYIKTKSMRTLWLVNQLWVIVPVYPRKKRASSELLYKSNRPQVSMGYYTLNVWSRGKQLVLFSWYFPRRSRGKH